MVEILATILIMAMVTTGVFQMIQHLQRGSRVYEANALLKTMGQAAVNRVGAKIATSKRFFDNTTFGRGHLAMLDLAAVPFAPLAGSKLPTILSTGSFSPSLYGSSETPFVPATVGNTLFLATFQGTYLVEGLGVARYVNTYRFDYYYLTRKALPGSLRFAGNDFVYDLVGWHSVLLADYHQLQQLLTEYPAQAPFILLNLTNARITYAWDYNTDNPLVSIYIYNISAGLLLNIANPTIPVQTYETVTRLSGPQGELVYSVAPNQKGDLSQYRLSERVPAFAPPDYTGDGFPHGFEVMIGGQSGGRRVFTRLVQSAESGKYRVYKETTGIFQGRDS